MTYLNGSIYVLGGFSHKDLPNEVPVTLASCERYSPTDNTWSYISTMNEARAFFATVVIENRFLYAMGGLHDFQVIQTIEKYDTISDSWLQVYFKLPMPLAKLGAVVVDNKQILVCGGVSDNFEPTRAAYSLDLTTVKWSKKAMMNHPRLVQQGLFYTNGFVFAVGGNAEAVCERYNVDTDKWVRIPNYNGRIEGESTLYTFGMCMMRAQ